MELHATPTSTQRQSEALVRAVSYGQIWKVQEILQSSPSKEVLNWQSEAGHTPLTASIQSDVPHILQQLMLTKLINPNATTARGVTALGLAVSLGQGDALKILLASGANPNLRYGPKDLTPLMAAVKGAQVQQIKLLLSHPQIDPNAVDASGNRPLLSAAHKGNIKIVQALLAHKDTDINARNTKNHNTPLIEAAALGHSEVVTELLKHNNLQPQLRNKGGFTPLMAAAKQGHLEVVELLLTLPEHLLNPNATDRYGSTAISMAVTFGHRQVVESLLKIPSLNINKANIYGDTPLMHAAYRGQAQVVERLLQNRASVNNQDRYQRTALHKAVLSGVLDSVLWVLDYQKQLSPDASGPAATQASTSMQLVKEHFVLPVQGLLGKSPQRAAGQAGIQNAQMEQHLRQSGFLRTVKLLISHGADPSIESRKGYRAWGFLQDRFLKPLLQYGPSNKRSTTAKACHKLLGARS